MRTTTITIPSGRYFDDIEFPWLYGLSGFIQNSTLEAAPFYDSITITRSGTGSRSKSVEVDGDTQTTTQAIDYTRTCKFNRVLNTDGITVDSFFGVRQFKDGKLDTVSLKVLDPKIVDNGTTESVTDGECYIHHNYIDVFSGIGVRPDYKKHYLEFKGTCVFDPVVYGTDTYNNGTGDPDYVTDLESFILISGPIMYRKDNTVLFFDTWNCPLGIGSGGLYDGKGHDLSDFSATKWRNLTGEKFSISMDETDMFPEDTEWDSNTVNHKVEWEIS